MFIHGLVRDDQGRKMSKSLGNGIDPLEMAEKYGADALRFNPGHRQLPRQRHALLPPERCEAIAQLRQQDLERLPLPDDEPHHRGQRLPEQLELEDKWILSKLNTVIREVTENMDHYELGVAAQKLYDFIWDTYCDWYIEMTKARLQGDNPAAKEQAQRVLCYVLTDILKLLHPFMPFLTEEIWQALPHEAGNEVKFLMLQSWPQYRQDLAFPRRRRRWSSLWTR